MTSAEQSVGPKHNTRRAAGLLRQDCRAWPEPGLGKASRPDRKRAQESVRPGHLALQRGESDADGIGGAHFRRRSRATGVALGKSRFTRPVAHYSDAAVRLGAGPAG